MDTHDTHRLQRHARRIEELRIWRNAREHPIENWRFAAGDEPGVATEDFETNATPGSEPGVATGSSGTDAAPAPSGPKDVKLGDFWPQPVALPVRLSAEVEVPNEWAGLPVELELWLGGEGFVRLSNGVTGGLNPFHRSYPVAEKAEGGEKLGIEAEVVSKGLFGSDVAEPRLTHAALVVPEPETRALERDLSVIAKACEQLDGHDVVQRLLDLLDAAFARLSAGWPSGSEAAVSRYLEGYKNPLGSGYLSLPRFAAEKALDVNRLGRELWSVPQPPRPLEPLPEGAREAARAARKLVAEGLGKLRKEYPPVGRLALTGHAHLDLAWLWPVSETRRKARRTFSSVLGLMDRYEDFVFNQSSAQLYEWIEGDDPELFGRIRGRVAEGRVEPVGGMLTEADCQITGGEAFVRQLLHGQRYFREKFGRRSTVAWLPDAFGFSPGIPQLLRGAGMTGFFTAKLSWNETDDFPHDLFEWEGLDGSRVVAHTLKNPGMDYNGDVVPFDLLGMWRNFRGKRRHGEALFPFGWGDGGGGPSEKMLENYSRLRDFPALPRLRMTGVDEFFASLPKEGLPVWVGELYLELHRGTLTTQGEVKKLNREAEHRLLEAEAFATIASLHGAEYPREDFDGLWKMLLLNQFHDILPGSSIREVNEEAREQLRSVVEGAETLRDGALRHLARRLEVCSDVEEVMLVANASLSPCPLSFHVPEDDPGDVTGMTDVEGRGIPTQDLIAGEGVYAHDPGREVPGLGWTALRVRRGVHLDTREGVPAVLWGPLAGATSGGGQFLENELLRVEIGADGTLHRVYDKELGREVLAGRGNQLWAYVDKPREWDAWDIDEDYELEGEEIFGVTGLWSMDPGPLQATVDVRRSWRGSRIEQTYRLAAGSRRLDIETSVEWHQREVLLRTLFPLNVRSQTATFETIYGAHERPTHRNTSWDAARFEVSAHRFADLSEPDYGAALLNDGKYGHSAKGNVIGLSLLRSPMYPDPFADEGHHHFTYALFPHPGDWTQGGVVEEAFALNSPLVAVSAAPGGRGMLPAEWSFVRAEGVTLALGSLKRAEDGRGAILRLYEPRGARGRCALRFALPVRLAERTNLLEEPEGPVDVEGSAVRFEVRPFEVVTLSVEFG